MSSYQVAVGYNNTAGYQALTPQPRCAGINYERWEQTPSGAFPIGYGAASLLYETFDDTLLETLLTALGLSSAFSREITIKLPTRSRDWGDFNAIIVYPKRLDYQYWYRGLIFELQRIEEI